MASGLPEDRSFERWARVNPGVQAPLRRGAWYPVLSVSSVEVVLDVNHRPLIVPRSNVEVLPSRPQTWSVVKSEPGEAYAVCPACAERAPLDVRDGEMQCPRCQGVFVVELDVPARGELTTYEPLVEARPINILLIEDREDDIALTLRALARAKIKNRVWVARDGTTGLELLRRQLADIESARPDLVLLDLNLPQLDGRDVLLRIREDTALESIPVVVLTASDGEQERLAALAADAFLTKPVDFERLGRVVRVITHLGWAIVKTR
jgi:CheY-like chemotaxis protein